MNTSAEIEGMLEARSFCVVGASRDPEKYGYAVYQAIKSSGKKVYPVNPNAQAIGTSPCYANVQALPETVDVAVFVVPPAVVETVVPEAFALGVKQMWMQPGAISEAAVEFCEANGIPVVAGECIMTRLHEEIADDDM